MKKDDFNLVARFMSKGERIEFLRILIIKLTEVQADKDMIDQYKMMLSEALEDSDYN